MDLSGRDLPFRQPIPKRSDHGRRSRKEVVRALPLDSDLFSDFFDGQSPRLAFQRRYRALFDEYMEMEPRLGGESGPVIAEQQMLRLSDSVKQMDSPHWRLKLLEKGPEGRHPGPTADQLHRSFRKELVADDEIPIGQLQPDLT